MVNHIKEIRIDLENGIVTVESDLGPQTHAMDTPEAYELISGAWLRCGWQNNHVYTYTWMGRPMIQLPEDMLRAQEVLYRLQPDVIVETGIAHGGSLIFYASLCELMGKGRVVGVDIEIRPHNRSAIEAHPLFNRITLVEGDSISSAVVEKVKSQVEPGESVFVMLDGCHTCDHVLAELKAYAPLVTPGSYIVAADGIMASLAGLSRFKDHRRTNDWASNNPLEAVKKFLSHSEDFTIDQPGFEFNESPLCSPVTYWPQGWLKRK